MLKMLTQKMDGTIKSKAFYSEPQAREFQDRRL
jgi:hypothetical protein